MGVVGVRVRDARGVVGGMDVPPRRFVNARHGAVTMDTLVSVGTIAAWTWSVVALLVS